MNHSNTPTPRLRGPWTSERHLASWLCCLALLLAPAVALAAPPQAKAAPPGRVLLGIGAHAIVVPALTVRADLPLGERWSVGPVVSAGRSDRATVFDYVTQLAVGVSGQHWLVGDAATGLALAAQAHYRYQWGVSPVDPDFGSPADPLLRAHNHGLIAALGVSARKQVGRLSVDLCLSAAREESWSVATDSESALEERRGRWRGLVQAWLGVWL